MRNSIPKSAAEYFGQAGDLFRTCLQMQPDLTDAAVNLELALAREARASARIEKKVPPPTDKDTSEQEPKEGDENESSEGDKTESDDESEGEDAEEGAEGEAKPSAQSQGANALDLETQDLPLPMVEPEELFRQESEQGELRQKQRATRYKSVEKDW
jgi:hypothetical protein